MSFFVTPNSISVDSPQPTSTPTTFIDILYDHRKYLENNNGLIAQKNCLQGRSIAIVGAGAAGLLAAYQLVSLGANVNVFEASHRYGGRIYSKHPIEGDAAIFEMGAMRVPPSEQLFDYYANQFGLESTSFPDPGVVKTELIYNNKVHLWEAGANVPEIFERISSDWNRFVTEELIPIKQLLTTGSDEDYAKAAQKWQSLIDSSEDKQPHYSEISFYQGVMRTFGKDWDDDALSLFGTLGLGSGGFGPLYPVSFSEIARLIINGLESHQRFYSGGLGALTDGLVRYINHIGDTGGGKCQFFYNTVIDGISQKNNMVALSVKNENPSLASIDFEAYDSAIVTTTTRAMQIDLQLTKKPNAMELPTISENIKPAIEGIHMMNSSKLFVVTKTKFWEKTDLPQNIQTDGLVRGLYCLDYPASNHGVVLISYTWGDDSTKLLALKNPQQRLDHLLASLQSTSPNFVNALKASLSEWGGIEVPIEMVDWQDMPHYYGAFKLNYPGQDTLNHDLYYQFLNSESNVYLAGDSVSFSGGWIEGALQTGMNAAAAIVRKHSPESLFDKNPISEQAKVENRYRYNSPG